MRTLNLMTLRESHDAPFQITAITAQDSAYYFNI